MKTQINLSKISFIEILLQFFFMFLLINLILFVFTILEGKPRFYLYPTSWISQLILPIAYSVIQNIINRNGVLTICNYDDIPDLKEKMKLIIDKKKINTIKEDKEAQVYIYTNKSKCGKFINFFIRDDIKINYSQNVTTVHAKRSRLNQINLNLSIYQNKINE